MKLHIMLAAGIVIIVTFLAGFWPQHRRAAALERETQDLHDRIAVLEGQVRGAELLGSLLDLTDAVSRRDFGRAQALSSTFFDQVRTQAASSAAPALRSGLPVVLAERDAVTAQLAGSDQQVMVRLHDLQLKLRSALGYPTS